MRGVDDASAVVGAATETGYPNAESTTLDIARWLVHERRFSVIGLDHPDAPIAARADQVGKVPCAPWKAFQECLPTDVNLSAWFGGPTPRNLAIVTGAVSGLVAVDCDSSEAEAWADANLPPTPMMTRTAKGTHRFYRHPGQPVPTKARILGDGLALDVRGDGGYVVGPGSLHHTGVRYERLGTWPEVQFLPVFITSWIAPMTDGRPGPGPRVMPDRDLGGSGAIDRARAYLAHIPGAVEGQGGDQQTYVVACRLVRDFALSLADARVVFVEWNSKCQPPWNERELDAKLEHALRYGEGAIGAKVATAWSLPRASSRTAAQPSGADEVAILDPVAPVPSAQLFLDRRHRVDGVLALRNQGGVFSEFHAETNTYADVDDAGIRAEVYGLLDDALTVNTRSGALMAFNPTKTKVDNVMDALRAETHLAADERAPRWLQDEQVALDPEDILPTTGGLLHLPTRQLLPGTAAFFAKSGVGFSYNPLAPRPALWLSFLEQLWPADSESQATLQEFFGYVLTPRTHQQKMLLIVGPKRGGKGTIGRVLTRLRGPAHVCAPTLSSMGTQFGLSTLIDKPLAIISDARIGGRTDTSIVVERLLSISGEDGISIPRKYLTDWTGKLPTRFVILTNELPRIQDSAGAFISRFIVLTLRNSFFGKEDPHLSDRLMAELPGILNWALDGWDRLRARGYFAQPSSSAAVITEFEDLSSPIAAFVRERCVVEPRAAVRLDDLFAEWGLWCRASGRDHTGTVHTFGRDLRAAVPTLSDSKKREDRGRIRYYEGIRQRLPGEVEE